jgi:hypothetical protein
MRVRSVGIIKPCPFSNRPITVGLLASSMFVMLLFCSPILPQTVFGARPGLIYYTVGDVYVDGQAIQIANQNYPVLGKGQVIRTGNGRAEIQLAPGVFVRLGEWGAISLVKNEREDTQVELQKGAAVVEIIRMARGDKLQIQCAMTSTEFKSTGVYRFDTDPAMLRVYGGTAEVLSSDREVALGPGRSVNLSRDLPVSKFSVKRTDALHLWAARRSFFLFTSNPEALKSQYKWGITASGWSTNRDYHVRLFSPVIAQEYARKQALEAQDRAKDKQIQDYVRALDRERARELSEQQAQQQQQRQQQTPPAQNKKQ